MIRELISGSRGGVAVDDSGHTLYNIIGSYRQDGENWLAVSDEKIDAAPTDNCIVKCSNSEYKVGIDDQDWPCGWKRRDDGKQFLARPLGVSVFDDLKSVRITESAGPYTYDKVTEILDCGFKDVTLKLVIDSYGIKCHTVLNKKLYEDNSHSQYFGVVWEMNDPDLLSIIMGMMGAQIYKMDDTHFVEYVQAIRFQECDIDGPTGHIIDVEHDYITTGGNLTTDTTWVAGTYYLTSDLVTHDYNFCLDCAAGNIVIKTPFNKTIFHSGYNNMWTANTDAQHKVIFTSVHDNSRGETIAGSSGHPVEGDQVEPYLHISYSPAGYAYYNNLSWVECHYCVIGNNWTGGAPITAYGLINSSFDITWKNFIFKYCGTQETSPTGSILGNLEPGSNVNSITIKNISIDDTNRWLNSSAYHYGILLRAKTVDVSDVYINMPCIGMTGGAWGLTVITSSANGVIANIKNCYVSGKFYYATIITGSGFAKTITSTISDCIAENTASNYSYGFNSRWVNGTVTTDWSNCIAINCDGGGTSLGYYKTGTPGAAHVARAWNCGSWNNTYRQAYLDSDTSAINTNPGLGLLPNDVLLDNNNCPHSNGLAITNRTDYEKKGSGTFNDLNIDETISSMTGYFYDGTDLVTPGIYYYLEPFRPKINWWV